MTPPSLARTAYLDECVDLFLADALRGRGFSAIHARDAGMSGATDLEQLSYAAVRDLVLISHNDNHFRRLHRRFRQDGSPHGGIVILPQRSTRPQLTVRAAMLLDWLTQMDDYRSRFFTWGDLQYLLTQGARLRGYDEADVRLALGQEP